METIAITGSKWIFLLSSSVLITISDFRIANNRLDETTKPILLKEKDGKLWMTK